MNTKYLERKTNVEKLREAKNMPENDDGISQAFVGLDSDEKRVTNRLKLDGEFNLEANREIRDDKDVNDDSSGNNDLDQDFDYEDAHVADSMLGTSPDNTPPQTPLLLSPIKPQISSSANNMKSRCRNFQNFKATLIDIFDLPYFSQRRFISPNSFRWKGLDWNVLAGFDSQSFGLFIGFDDWEEITPDWAIAFRYKFEVLDDDNTVLLCKIDLPYISVVID